MKNIICTAAIAIAVAGFSTIAQAQHPYTFSKLTEAYVPLTNATSVNNNAIWEDTSTFVVPVGFNFKMGGVTTNKVTLTDGTFISPAYTGIQSGFGIIGTSLNDRNMGKTTAASPIRYTVTGATGNRIFKLEVFNAGFTEEQSYNTDDDSICYQVWIYEQNSAVDIRFGPSRISHFQDYFFNKVVTGYIKNLNTATFDFEKMYVLNGNSAAPVMDSMNTFDPAKGLSTVPVSGTVYKYVPRSNTTGIGNIRSASLGRIYPSPVNNQLFIESTSATHFQVLSINGSIIKEGTINNKRQTEDVSDLAPGMYLLRLVNNNQETDIKRFIRQ